MYGAIQIVWFVYRENSNMALIRVEYVVGQWLVSTDTVSFNCGHCLRCRHAAWLTLICLLCIVVAAGVAVCLPNMYDAGQEAKVLQSSLCDSRFQVLAVATGWAFLLVVVTSEWSWCRVNAWDGPLLLLCQLWRCMPGHSERQA